MLLGISRSLIQLLCFPIVLFVLSRVKIAGMRMPRWALVLSVVGALGATVPSLVQRSRVEGKVVVARLVDDKVGGVTRALMADLERELQGVSASVQAATFERSFKSDREVRASFGDGLAPTMLIWGSVRWLQISLFDSTAVLAQKAALIEKMEGVLGLTPVLSVPTFGISREPRRDILQYVASFVAATLGAKQIGESAVVAQAEHEARYRSLASSMIRSRSLAYKAYPAWVVGTQHLERGVLGSEREPAELKCAVRSFQYAYRYLRTHDNPELRAAILNNWALATYAQWYLYREHTRKKARKLLKLARATRREKNLYGVELRARLVAVNNMRHLKKAGVIRKRTRAGHAKKQRKGKQAHMRPHKAKHPGRKRHAQ